MTRRSSVRAHARKLYRDLAAKKATADPPSPGGFGGQGLTARVRALYEDSAVPVREIAGVAGVTERTIYKYAAKQRWKKRYARTGDFASDFAPDFAPVRGAGSRFIRREDKAKPIATGLKATDPVGRARAAAGCGEAQRLSRAAQAEAAAAQRAEATIRAIEWTNSAFKELREFYERRDKGPPGPLDDRVEDLLTRVVNLALSRWQALLAEEEEGGAGA
jgi:hypothetical protein